MEDDRVTCNDCTALRFNGECREAVGRLARIRDLPRRCECFRPKGDAADQRCGWERWPSLVGEPGGPERIPFPPRDDRKGVQRGASR